MTDDPFGPGTRRALVIANGRYRHRGLPDLESPTNDAQLAKRVLENPELGRFDEVQVLEDRDVASMERALVLFFRSAQPDDFLFVYLSSHGKIDDDTHRLFLCAIDTDPDLLLPTAMPADFLAQAFESCKASRIVTVLDCCHAGAFEGEFRQRRGDTRILILTASRYERAHEGDEHPSHVGPSAFAGAFFGGLESGAADVDENGWISVREAFNHAFNALRDTRQTPQMRGVLTNDLFLARSPITARSLPPELASLVRHQWPSARLLAVDELGHWLGSEQPSRQSIAEDLLTRLRNDPDQRVAHAAGQRLAGRHAVAHGSGTEEPVATELPPDPDWHRRTIFYEVRVRSFADGDGDGIGDFAGLTERLDYLQWLGVGTLLLTPIYDSPLEDDGHDASDFYRVHPDLGTLDEFLDLVTAAHRRGIRVMLDLVLNHTSRQHRWFAESRRDPAGRYGDYYVWRSESEPAAEHWTFDPVRGQYYWHRFGVCEPDLNFDADAVQQEMIDVLRYWLDRGVDGFRLVTAPYLFERVGTAGEGLDETHAYLHRLRSEVDKNYPGRLLLGWADRWPSGASEYFGSAERPECGVVLYTSLMPKIFLGMRQETHYPVSEVLSQTTRIRDDCQWASFLRNGDELSLENVDENDRRSLREEYAPSARMLTSTGIRRRLAPLLDGDRNQLELCMALLLSLPGSPVLYYGDEIGMGENLALPDCAAIRTPMQWTADRGAGFSTASPDNLASPLVVNPAYAPAVVNVEAQRGERRSVLKTVRGLVQARRKSEALTIGAFEPVASRNAAVLAYLRRTGSSAVLCLANFSQYAQAAALTLDEFAGRQPIEMSGHTRFGLIGTDPYPVTLSGHGFFWFELTASMR